MKTLPKRNLPTMNTILDIEMSNSAGDINGVVSQLHIGNNYSSRADLPESNLATPQTNSLYVLASSNQNLQNFLTLTGNYWPETNNLSWLSIIARTNFVLSQFAVLGCAGLLAAAAVLTTIFASINSEYFGIFFCTVLGAVNVYNLCTSCPIF